MGKENSCCFSGNREVPSGVRKLLSETTAEKICELYEKGYTDFYAGGAIGFDEIAEEAVLFCKKAGLKIKLHIIVPFRGQSSKWSPEQKKKYEDLLKEADEVVVLSEEYTKYCFHVRNRYMVDNSSAIIYYSRKDTGGTASTVAYAKKKGLFEIAL